MSPDNTTTSSTPDSEQEIVACTDPQDRSKPCPICKGLGVIQYNVPFDDSRFGKLFRCPNNRVEEDVDRYQRLQKLSNLSAFSDKTFDNFGFLPSLDERQRDSLRHALNQARNYANKPDGWLMLQGPYGTGKTHLAAAVGNERLRLGDAVLFITSPDLLDYLRQAYTPGADVTYDELFDRVRNTPVLIVDDLGVENPSQWANEKLFQLLNHRYTNRLPTVITTNKDLEHLDPRLRSRLLDHNIIHHVIINAPDYRDEGHKADDPLEAHLDLYREMTFETFDTQTKVTLPERDNLQRALNAARSYAQSPMGWFCLMGSETDPRRTYGNGKTHLAAAIANYRRQADTNVYMATVSDLMDHLRQAFDPNDTGTGFEERMQRIRDVKLLVVDDLNTANLSRWSSEKLFQILDYRYLRNLPTVLTFEGFKVIDARLRSRLLDRRKSAVFRLEAPSYAERIHRQ